ncbi:hypothetical protein FSB78_05615 [Sphingomonas ginsenosidivorax]|uniref:MmcQ/YjbR family DNA-binding protein n=1 Tax=Sphingomonas ginsenosidivorax TaxID=862135 RepID=A0A5C6UJB9_9SPHN|nr:MmcQ/YjbR family DNA-binding protein [Sphingomonas ginsenosidivorax]TXC72779.1 hypothetical protein FSB78_05615 [Sphingomonas ginsenosidivorax]
MKDWDAVAAFALSLPETEVSTSYGQPAVKVRGKMFVSTGHEAGSFHVRSTHEEKALLIETDPATFWQTPHYETWPGLLVRYASGDAERIRVVIARAWWDQAPARARKGFGDRP